jgi:hypothetical protein
MLKNWRSAFIKLKPPARLYKKYFWFWVLYQAVKGILTLSLIWIPLIYVSFFKK